MNKNEKTFRLVNKTNQIFSIIIANFEFVATLLFNIRNTIDLTYIMTLYISLISNIRLRRIRISISQVKLITRITQAINSKRIILLIIFRQSMKAVVSVYLRNPINFVAKIRQKLVAIMYEGILHIATTPVFVTLFTLGHWDPFTLLPLDSMTLGEMDYTVV